MPLPIRTPAPGELGAMSIEEVETLYARVKRQRRWARNAAVLSVGVANIIIWFNIVGRSGRLFSFPWMFLPTVLLWMGVALFIMSARWRKVQRHMELALAFLRARCPLCLRVMEPIGSLACSGCGLDLLAPGADERLADLEQELRTGRTESNLTPAPLFIRICLAMIIFLFAVNISRTDSGVAIVVIVLCVLAYWGLHRRYPVIASDRGTPHDVSMRMRAFMRMECPSCGYDCSTSPDRHTCPECGLGKSQNAAPMPGPAATSAP